MKMFLAALLLALFSSVASADTVWTYTGNIMDGSNNNPDGEAIPAANCNCALDGTFTFDDSGSLIAWNLTDGTHTLNQTDSISDFFLADPASGFWAFAMSGDDLSFSSFGGMSNADYASFGDDLFGFVGGNPGTWSTTTATPEPATIVLLCSGLLLLLALKR
jgi:hypothetical protein